MNGYYANLSVDELLSNVHTDADGFRYVIKPASELAIGDVLNDSGRVVTSAPIQGNSPDHLLIGLDDDEPYPARSDTRYHVRVA